MLSLVAIVLSISLSAQSLKPIIQIKEDPKTHNMHITSDGEFYYTCNGGKPDKGRINKFDFDGNLIDTYIIKLDMRSIMYNGKDKHFYVCSYDGNIYKITDIKYGSFEVVHKEIYSNAQANLALSPNGKLLYYFNEGVLLVYNFKNGKLKKTITGLDCGKDVKTGSSCVAVDDKYIYTWNSDYSLIFIYDLKGNKIKSEKISKGNYGFSLSYANGLIFVSIDGDYGTGYWYGYDLWKK